MLLEESLSRQEIIKLLKNWGKFYNFDRFTDEQLFNIFIKTKAKFDRDGYPTQQKQVNSSDDFIKKDIKRCPNCNTRLNDAGECPVCDLGDEDMLYENIEKHDELNPKLWNKDNTLKEEVKEKIKLIVEDFCDNLNNDEIKFNLTDIKLVGSNCSYNYNKDSDLDIHLVMETNSLQCPDNLYPLLYSAYRSIYNNKLDIDFYGIPVEIFVETDDTQQLNEPVTEAREQTALKSNGVFSVMNDTWIKEPVKEDIPEIDKEAFDKEFKEWEDRYNKIVNKSEEKLDESLEEKFNGIIEAVVELPDFEDARKEFQLSDEDIEVAKQEIIQNPNIGDVIKGCLGARKIRIAISANNKGKSGGARAAYLNYYPDKTAYFISIIIKSDQEDFTDAQKKQIKKAVEFIKK